MSYNEVASSVQMSVFSPFVWFFVENLGLDSSEAESCRFLEVGFELIFFLQLPFEVSFTNSFRDGTNSFIH